MCSTAELMVQGQNAERAIVGDGSERWARWLARAGRARRRQQVLAALREGRAHLAARLALELVYEQAYLAHDIEGAWALMRVAEARLAAADFPLDLMATSHRFRGILNGLGGRHDESEAAFREARDLFEAVHGSTHETTAEAVANLGAAYFFQHRYAEAVLAFERGAQLQAEAVGENHPSLAGFHRNVGSTYWELGDFAAAKRAFERSMAICELNDGRGSLPCALPRSKVGEIQILFGAFSEARATLAPVQKAQREHGRPGAPTTAWADELLAGAALGRGDYDEALRHARAADESTRALARASQHRRVEVATVLAGVQLARGEFDEAMHWIERGRGAMNEPGLFDGGLVWLMALEARVWAARKRWHKALEVHESALRGLERVFGADNGNLAATMISYAGTLSALGRHERAWDQALRGLELQVAAFGPENHQLAATHLLMAGMAMDAGDHSAAGDALAAAQRLADPTQLQPWRIAELELALAAWELTGERPEGKRRASELATRALKVFAEDSTTPTHVHEAAVARVKGWNVDSRDG